MLFFLVVLQVSSQVPISYIPKSKTPPPQRYYALLTYCALRESFIIFGGSSGSDNYNDIWEYSLSDLGWSQVDPISNEVPGIT